MAHLLISDLNYFRRVGFLLPTGSGQGVAPLAAPGAATSKLRNVGQLLALAEGAPPDGFWAYTPTLVKASGATSWLAAKAGA